MLKRLAGALALAGVAGLLSGCATLVHGTSERVYVDSTPPGAQVDIDDGEQQATTPAEVRLSRSSGHRLVFHKAGYEDATEHLTSGMSGWILGNVVAGGAIGLVVDAADGAGRKLSADSVKVTLTALPQLPPLATAAAAVLEHQAPASMPSPKAQPAARSPGTQPEGPPPQNFDDDESAARPAAGEPAPGNSPNPADY
jgi:hypothetical protein